MTISWLGEGTHFRSTPDAATMGNCIHVDKSQGTSLKSEDFEDLLANLMDNYTYGDDPFYDDSLPQPCQFTFCLNFINSILALLVAASILGLLCSVGLAVTLAKRPHLWNQHGPGKLKLYLLSAAAAVFTTTLPFFAVGIKQGWIFGYPFCQVTRALRHGCLFAQGLIVAGSTYEIPQPLPGLLSLIILWMAGFLCATPAAMASSSGNVCVTSPKPEVWPWSLAHTLVSLAIFVILPLGMLLAKMAMTCHGKKKCLQIDLTWLFYLFWSPYGVALLLDKLLQDERLTSTCRFQEHLDYFLGISEGFGILHCFLLPLLILGSGICRRKIDKASKP